MKSIARSFLALGIIACLAAPAWAQRLDGIAAIVNDDAILQSDVEEQLALLMQRAQTPPDSAELDTLRHQILEQLIDDRLIFAEAKRQGLTVSDAEIEKQVVAAIADAKERMGSEQAFREQLKRENTTEEKLREKYRSDLKKQAVGQRLMAKQFPEHKIPQAEAETFFKANIARFPKVPPEARLSVIQIPISADSATEAKGRAAVLAARKRVTGGEKFAKVAAEVSDDPNSARAGGDLGFFAMGSMEPTIEDAAFSMKLNQLSEPIRTPYGWHIIEVLERDTLKTRGGRDSLTREGKPLLEAHVRHILIKVNITDGDAERARALATRVRGEAAKGTNFGTLVRRYSRYSGQQTEEGDIGFVSMGNLQPSIRSGIDSLEVGQISEVLSNQIGFNVFKVTDRKPERPYTLEEIRDELPAAVAQVQLKDRYDAWIKTLREKAHVEYR